MSASIEGQMCLFLLDLKLRAVLACPDNEQQAKAPATAMAVPGSHLTKGIAGLGQGDTALIPTVCLICVTYCYSSKTRACQTTCSLKPSQVMTAAPAVKKWHAHGVEDVSHRLYFSLFSASVWYLSSRQMLIQHRTKRSTFPV